MSGGRAAGSRPRRVLVATMLLGALLAPSAFAYELKRSITIDRSKISDGSCGSTLTNFPMLFSVTDPDLANAPTGSVTDPGGDDIIFVALDAATCGGPANCTLDHEIERYVNTTGELVAWVRIPFLNTSAAASDTVIYVVYGDSTVTTPTENPTGVWDASYLGVWHLEEAVTDEGSGGVHDDSTSNGNDGVQSANGPFTGVIADGQDLDGTGDFITIADNDSLSFDPDTPFSASAWISTDTTTRNIIIGKEGPAAGPSEWDFYVRSTGKLTLTVMDGRYSNRIGRQTVDDFPTGAWHYVSATYDGSGTSAGIRLYIDGVQPATADYSAGTYVAMDNSTTPVWIGAYDGGGNNYDMDGRVDEVRLSSTERSACWVDAEYDNQLAPGDVGAPGFYTIGAATAVELTSFEARGLNGSVELSWETGSEVDNLGFHLYRSTSSSGPYERVTSLLIPGLGSSPEGARYRYVDGGLENGVTYYYELEDVETTGRVERHGPVSATPEVGVVDDDDGAPASAIVYGKPEENRLRVVKRGRNETVLELTTEGFVAYPEGDGSVRLEMEGYLGVGDEGLPTRTAWVEALAGRKVELVSVRERDVERLGLRPEGAAELELVGSSSGIVELKKRGGRSGKKDRASGGARLVSVAFQGEVKKALVEMAPLRWDASREELRLARKLEVTLSFAKKDRDERVGRDGRRGRRSPEKDRRGNEGVVARLATRAPGLYAVSYEEVFGRGGGHGVESAKLGLSRLGEMVAFHLEPSGPRFGPGGFLYFVSPGAAANPYGDEAVFELAYGVSDGVVMSVREAAPSSSDVAADTYLRRDAYEENHIYQATLRDSESRWMWEMLFAPGRKGYRFPVDALASGAEPSRLELWLQGGTDFPASPDHHVVVYVNGTRVAERSWNGKRAQTVEVELWPGVLHEGENLLEVENLGDTEARYSMVYLDRYAVTYSRRAWAEDDWLEGLWTTSGTAAVSGVSPSVSIVDTTGPQPSWLTGASSDRDGVVRFRGEAKRRYLVVDDYRVRSPEVRRASAPRWTDGSHQADYLVLGPRAFLEAATPLLDHRRRQGLTTLAVPVEEIYDELGHGESRPEALRDFLAYAYHHWTLPSPRYVLLLGDASYDFKDYYGTGVGNPVPPFMLETSYLWTASDPAYAAVNGDDLLPDVALGRLPAANVDEVRSMVEKILAYETGDASLGGRVVLVSDDPDAAGDFPADAEALAATVLAGRVTKHLSLKELGPAATRLAVREAFDEGASMLSYVGHGGIHLWADEDLLDVTSVGSLSPQPQQPLLLTMNCLNGYFHFPFFDSLSEALVKAEGKGAIAAFSPSGMSLNAPAHLYHEALLSALVHGHHARLGDAVLAAQEAYAETGAFPELLSIYHLLGDPALTLR